MFTTSATKTAYLWWQVAAVASPGQPEGSAWRKWEENSAVSKSVAALNFGIQGLSPNAGNLKCIEMQYIYILYIYNWGLSTTASLCSTLKWKSKSWSSPLITTISGPCTATTWDQLIQWRHVLLHSSPMFIQATALRTIILHCQGIWGNWVLQG